MQVIQQFDEFESAFRWLNKLLDACETPYVFPDSVTDVRDFVKAYADIQFDRIISTTGFSYVDFHLKVDECSAVFNYVSTSGTSVWASFDTLIWNDVSPRYEVGVDIPKQRCTKTGHHYNAITKLLFGGWQGWLRHESGRVVKPKGAESLPTPEWLLARRSNFILWNNSDKLNTLFEKLGFRAESQALFPRMWVNKEGYKVIQSDRLGSGYKTPFTILGPLDTYEQGGQLNSLLSVLHWIKAVKNGI